MYYKSSRISCYSLGRLESGSPRWSKQPGHLPEMNIPPTYPQKIPLAKSACQRTVSHRLVKTVKFPGSSVNNQNYLALAHQQLHSWSQAFCTSQLPGDASAGRAGRAPCPLSMHHLHYPGTAGPDVCQVVYLL